MDKPQSGDREVRLLLGIGITEVELAELARDGQSLLTHLLHAGGADDFRYILRSMLLFEWVVVLQCQPLDARLAKRGVVITSATTGRCPGTTGVGAGERLYQPSIIWTGLVRRDWPTNGGV